MIIIMIIIVGSKFKRCGAIDEKAYTPLMRADIYTYMCTYIHTYVYLCITNIYYICILYCSNTLKLQKHFHIVITH